MERLSIDEIIAHCERNTQSNERFLSKEYFENEDMNSWHMKEYWEHRQVAECLKELKAYRDAEEQGLLLRLPCKVGDTVYQVSNGKIREYRVGSFNIANSYIFVSLQYLLGSVCQSADCFGKTVFLTKEEAEQKLASMQKGE